MQPVGHPISQSNGFEIFQNIRGQTQRLLKSIIAIASTIFRSMSNRYFAAGFLVGVVAASRATDSYITMFASGLIFGFLRALEERRLKFNLEFRNASRKIDLGSQVCERKLQKLSQYANATHIAAAQIPYMEIRYASLASRLSLLKSSKPDWPRLFCCREVDTESVLTRMKQLNINWVQLSQDIDSYSARCLNLCRIEKTNGAFPDAHETLSDDAIFKISNDALLSLLPKTPK